MYSPFLLFICLLFSCLSFLLFILLSCLSYLSCLYLVISCLSCLFVSFSHVYLLLSCLSVSLFICLFFSCLSVSYSSLFLPVLSYFGLSHPNLLPVFPHAFPLSHLQYFFIYASLSFLLSAFSIFFSFSFSTHTFPCFPLISSPFLPNHLNSSVHSSLLSKALVYSLLYLPSLHCPPKTNFIPFTLSTLLFFLLSCFLSSRLPNANSSTAKE